MHTSTARFGPRSGLWSRGGLTWTSILIELWKRTGQHGLQDRAGLLSYYLLLALFPLLLVLSSLIGFLLASQAATYWELLNYVFRFMPSSAFTLLTEMLTQLRSGASGGKISFGLLASLWTASSGFAAFIEALNVAFAVPNARSWWHRRLVALGFTFSIGGLVAAALGLLVVSSTAGTLLTARLPVLNVLSRASGAERWLVCVGLLFCSLALLYRYGPNLQDRDWQGVLPGTCLALGGWFLASVCLRAYLVHFGSLSRSYGSLAGVIALLFWLYLSAFAILLGGELNALLWHNASSVDRVEGSAAPSELPVWEHR